jgi:peptidoglycan/xylan/chitin deacetylase (PgdA/CDA1 family)
LHRDRNRGRTLEDTIDANGYTTRHSEVARRSVRSTLRRHALDLLSIGLKMRGKLERALARPRVHFVYLHHVFEDEELAFRDSLRYLAQTHHFLSYSEGIDRALNGPIDAPYLCFSSDDGLKTNVRAAEIMADTGAKACFFVCPPQIGADFHQAKKFCVGQLALPATELMNWDDVAGLLSAGHEIGSHTLSHLTLANLSQSQLEDEIGASRRELSRRIGSVDHFAWPRGQFHHMSPQAAKLVFDFGYASCASAKRGCHVVPTHGGPHSLCVRREHWVTGWPPAHLRYFLARSSERACVRDNAWPADWPANWPDLPERG